MAWMAVLLAELESSLELKWLSVMVLCILAMKSRVEGGWESPWTSVGSTVSSLASSLAASWRVDPVRSSSSWMLVSSSSPLTAELAGEDLGVGSWMVTSGIIVLVASPGARGRLVGSVIP